MEGHRDEIYGARPLNLEHSLWFFSNEISLFLSFHYHGEKNYIKEQPFGFVRCRLRMLFINSHVARDMLVVPLHPYISRQEVVRPREPVPSG